MTDKKKIFLVSATYDYPVGANSYSIRNTVVVAKDENEAQDKIYKIRDELFPQQLGEYRKKTFMETPTIGITEMRVVE